MQINASVRLVADLTAVARADKAARVSAVGLDGLGTFAFHDLLDGRESFGGDNQAVLVAGHAGFIDNRHQYACRLDKRAELKIHDAVQQAHFAEIGKALGLHFARKTACRFHGDDLLCVVRRRVADDTAVHRACKAACAARKNRFCAVVKFIASGDHVIAVDELAHFFFYIVVGHCADRRQFSGKAAVHADMFNPRVPLSGAELFERAVDIRLFDCGIDHVQRAYKAVGADQAAEHRETSALGGAGRLHESDVAAGVFRAVDGTDAYRVTGAFIFAFLVSVYFIAQPCGVAVAPDLSTRDASHIAAGTAAKNGERHVVAVGGAMRSHRAAAGNTGGAAVVDGGNEGLYHREKVIGGEYAAEQVGDGAVFLRLIVEDVEHVAGVHFARVAAGRDLADDVGEVVGVAVLNVRARHLSGETAGVADALFIETAVAEVDMAGGQYRVAARFPVDVGMFDGGYDHLKTLQHGSGSQTLIQQLDGIAQGSR